MPQGAVYLLNYHFIDDATFPWPEYLGVRTKKQDEFLSPLTLMTHSQKTFTPIATNLCSVVLEVLFPKEGIYLPD